MGEGLLLATKGGLLGAKVADAGLLQGKAALARWGLLPACWGLLGP